VFFDHEEPEIRTYEEPELAILGWLHDFTGHKRREIRDVADALDDEVAGQWAAAGLFVLLRSREGYPVSRIGEYKTVETQLPEHNTPRNAGAAVLGEEMSDPVFRSMVEQVGAAERRALDAVRGREPGSLLSAKDWALFEGRLYLVPNGSPVEWRYCLPPDVTLGRQVMRGPEVISMPDLSGPEQG